MVLPVSLAGTETTAAISAKSAVLDTSKKYVTLLVTPSVAPFTTKKSGLLLFKRPAGAIALGASIRDDVTTAGGSPTAAISWLAIAEGASGFALRALSQPMTQSTATRATGPRVG